MDVLYHGQWIRNKDAVPFWTTGVKQVQCLETAQAGAMHNMAKQLNCKT